MTALLVFVSLLAVFFFITTAIALKKIVDADVNAWENEEIAKSTTQEHRRVVDKLKSIEKKRDELAESNGELVVKNGELVQANDRLNEEKKQLARDYERMFERLEKEINKHKTNARILFDDLTKTKQLRATDQNLIAQLNHQITELKTQLADKQWDVGEQVSIAVASSHKTIQAQSAFIARVHDTIATATDVLNKLRDDICCYNEQDTVIADEPYIAIIPDQEQPPPTLDKVFNADTTDAAKTDDIPFPF